jgi:hypothetical protein
MKKLPYLAVVIVGVASLLVSSRAMAQDATMAAKQAFSAGMKHFDLEEYRAALDDFRAGYRAKEDPVFLYNIAQCHRVLKEHREALRYYRLYLNRLPNAENRAEVEQKIAGLQAAIAAQNLAAKTSPARVLPSEHRAGAAEAPPVAVTPTDASVNPIGVASPATRAKPAYKKWWVWTIVGVVAAGAAVGVGVGVSRAARTSGSDFPPVSF